MSASMAVPSKYKNTYTTSEKTLSFIIAEVDVPVKWLRPFMKKILSIFVERRFIAGIFSLTERPCADIMSKCRSCGAGRFYAEVAQW